MAKLADIKKKLLKNDEVRRGYEDAAAEFALSEHTFKTRARAHISQDVGARKLKASQSAIARLVSGGRAPSIFSLHRYANIAGTKPKI